MGFRPLPSVGETKRALRNDAGSEESASLRRALSHDVRHVDPGAGALPARARRSGRLHRGCRARRPGVLGSPAGAAAHPREHRHRGRDLPDRQTTERRAGPRLRGRAAGRMHVHPRRHPLCPRHRHAPAGDGGRGGGHGRLHARGNQGLDVPPRPGLGGRLGERTDPRLPDVPLGPGAAGRDVAGAHRRAADHRVRDGRDVRRRPQERRAPRASPRSPSSCGSCSSASTAPSRASDPRRRSSGPTPAAARP